MKLSLKSTINDAKFFIFKPKSANLAEEKITGINLNFKCALYIKKYYIRSKLIRIFPNAFKLYLLMKN